MAEPSRSWSLESFLERLDAWVALEGPSDLVRFLATAWILSRFDDPYQGVSRAEGFANLWYGPIPGCRVGGRVVVCSYWIFERERVVRCDNFATLGLPI